MNEFSNEADCAGEIRSNPVGFIELRLFFVFFYVNDTVGGWLKNPQFRNVKSLYVSLFDDLPP